MKCNQSLFKLKTYCPRTVYLACSGVTLKNKVQSSIIELVDGRPQGTCSLTIKGLHAARVELRCGADLKLLKECDLEK